MQKLNIDSQVVKLMLIKTYNDWHTIVNVVNNSCPFLLADKEHPLTIKQGEQAKF